MKLAEPFMRLLLSNEFLRDVKKIRDKGIQERIKIMLNAVLENPDKGKNFHYGLKGKKSVRVKPFRIIYEVNGQDVHILKFDHRKGVYD